MLAHTMSVPVSLFLVYVVPIRMISGTTKRVRSDTSQQHMKAINSPKNKVAKHDRKCPNCSFEITGKKKSTSLSNRRYYKRIGSADYLCELTRIKFYLVAFSPMASCMMLMLVVIPAMIFPLVS